jgi:hypothetical protein
MQLRYGKLMVSAIAALAVAGAYAQWTITIDPKHRECFWSSSGTLNTAALVQTFTNPLPQVYVIPIAGNPSQLPRETGIRTPRVIPSLHIQYLALRR